jgi:hypothetical protein
MKLSPCRETTSRSAIQEFPKISWDPKIHFSVHKTSPLIPTLGQINPVHSTASSFSKFHLNNILPRKSWSSWWTIFFWPSHRSPICIAHFRACYLPWPPHPPWLDYSNYTWRRVQAMKLLIMQFSLPRFMWMYLYVVRSDILKHSQNLLTRWGK